MNSVVKKLVLSAMFLALCLVLPFLTGQLQQFGKALLPMHIPVLLCGLICGWQYGLAVGAIAPILRSLIFAMPPLWPMAFSMAFELAGYGFMTGLMYKFLPKKKWCVYPNLIISMIAGRIVYGIVMFTLSGMFANIHYSFESLVTGTVIEGIPGIILQIVLIPVIIIALEQAKLLPLKEH